MATKEQKKKIYALGAKCGMLDSSRGADDELHLWVQQWYPDKLHVSDLSENQADFIIKRLEDFLHGLRGAKAPERMSEEQKNKAFRLTYLLAELSPSDICVRDRLAGVVAKVKNREVKTNGGIFAGCSAADGSEIIEALKRYIETEKRKQRGERNGNVKSGGAPPS